jgi:hypothetical protein
MQHNPCGKYCVRNVIYHEKGEKKRKNRETKNAEIINVVYMELHSGAKMVNEKDLKTKSKNREFTVYATVQHNYLLKQYYTRELQ